MHMIMQRCPATLFSLLPIPWAVVVSLTTCANVAANTRRAGPAWGDAIPKNALNWTLICYPNESVFGQQFHLVSDQRAGGARSSGARL